MITTPISPRRAACAELPFDSRPERGAGGDSQPVGVLLHDSGRILAVNRAGALFFGRPVVDLVQSHLSDWVGEDARGAFATALQGGLASSRRIRVSSPDGADLRLEMIPQGWLTFQSRLVQMVLVRSATAGASSGTERWVGKAGSLGAAGNGNGDNAATP